jgi:hypothetical protein
MLATRAGLSRAARRIQTQPGREEAVDAVAVGKGPQHAARRGELGRYPRAGVLHDEPRVGRAEALDHVFVLVARDRAHGVHEDAAGSHERRHAVQDLPLQRREPRDILRAAAPAELGMARERAEAAARGVDEDCVEKPGERRPSRISGRDDDRVRAETVGFGGDPACPGGAPVERGDEAGTAEQRRRVRGLAAGRGARVEDPRAGRHAEHRGDELRGLALEGEVPGAPRGRAAEPRRRLLDDEAVGRPAARCRARARGGERVAQRLRRRSEPARAHRGRGPLVVRREQAGQLVEPDLRAPALDEPARMRPLDRESAEGIGGDPGGRARRIGRGAPEDGVDEPCGAPAGGAREPYAASTAA